jgi:3D (Asp-Asp-Asp) domain-containing protein
VVGIIGATSMVIEAILIGTLTVTSYRAVPEQTKPECTGRYHCETANGENVSELGIAVSQDFIRSGQIHFGDVLYIPTIGYRIVNDVMSARLRRSVDIFVYTRNEEKKIGVRHWKVFLIHEKQKSPEGE